MLTYVSSVSNNEIAPYLHYSFRLKIVFPQTVIPKTRNGKMIKQPELHEKLRCVTVRGA